MTETRVNLIVCKDERLCRLLENELGNLGIHAVSRHHAPAADDGIRMLLWDCDNIPAAEGIATATAHDCPLLLFGRSIPDPDPTAENVLFLRRPFALADLEKAVRTLSGDVLPARFAPYTSPAPPKTSSPTEPLLTACDGTVTIGDRSIPLTPAEWAIFKHLYDHRGEPIPRDTLASLLGGGGNSVDVYICHLRTKIEKPLGRRMIHTVRGVGYRMD